MRGLFLFLVSACLSFTLFSQDTTWVQTFTYDSISTRRSVFNFPPSLETKRFEKVLMYYNLKCSPLTPWDNYNCGEWDYLAYTRVFEHTGIMDSIQVDSVNYLANYTSPATYVYNTSPYSQIDTYQRVENKRTGVSTTLHPLVMTADGTSNLPFNVASNGSRYQMLISASDLLSVGVVAGNLQSLSLDLNSITGNGTLINPTISLKSTLATELLSFETSGFTTVYDNTHATGSTQNELVVGQNELLFYQPFLWDGTSAIIVEFVFDRPIASTNQLVFNTASIASNQVLSYPTKNGVLNINTGQKALLELSNVDLGTEFTIQFWSKGTGVAGMSTSVLEAYDTLGNRVINIHFPWSDNNIYFDAGEGSGYDRISKLMTVAEIDNNWNHWSFVKNAATGSMKIFKNGVLWHSGTGKVAPIGEFHRLVLGTNIGSEYNWKGKLDEFQLFDVALPDAVIAANYKNKTTAAHPNYANLLAYYDFDEVEYAVDLSQNDHLIMPSDFGMFDFSEMPNAGVNQEMNKPIIGFGQSLDAGAVTTNTVSYPKSKEPQVVFEFTANDNYFDISNAFIALPSGNELTYDPSGSEVASTPFVGSEQLNKSIITYYKVPFEIVNDIEIGRFITPYGINFDLGPNGFTWIYDVTDYQDYFMGDVDLAAHNTQELIDLKFAFIEGIPPRDVHSRQAIWSDWKSYNYGQMANDEVLSEVQVELADTSEMFKIKTRFTGHGHNGNGQCCEWAPKTHRIALDGVNRFNWSIWQESECGDSPNPAQGGTWPYAREGWCPGDLVKDFDHDITPFVQPGGTVAIDYGIDAVPSADPNQAGGNYVVAMDLISYSAPNFQHDAAIVDILNPNSYEYYRKWNPTCSNPRIIIQNTGEQPLTTCIIRCWTTYGDWQEFTWNGNLAFLEKEVVEIPITNPTFWSNYSGDHTFHAQVYAVGGYPELDEYAQNNYKSSKFESPEVIDGPFYVWFKTNNKASENSYKLIDSEGNTVFSRTNLTNNTEYKDTFDLDMGCYSIIVEDTDSDGLGYWYSAQAEGETNGFFRVRKVSGIMMEDFPRDFGNFHRYDFSVGFAVGLNELEIENRLLIFPNPTDGEFTVEVEGAVGSDARLEIMDITGRTIYTTVMASDPQFAQSKVDLSGMPSGQYFAIVRTHEHVFTQKFIKN